MAGGLVAGTATPVFAHHNTISGEVVCKDGGGWTTNWKVVNSESDKSETIIQSNRSVVPVGTTIAAGGTKYFSEHFTTKPTADVTLTLKGRWSNGVTQVNSGTVSKTAFSDDCTTKQVDAKALCDHQIDSTEWHFVATQVKDEASADDFITVTWDNGQTAEVPLSNFTGGVAHYTTTLNLGSNVTSAVMDIYGSWSGQFNLSHGPACEGGQSNFTKNCESITLEAPTGVRPAGAQYRYKIDGVVKAVGTHPATPGNHTITLEVLRDGVWKQVDSDKVWVDECPVVSPVNPTVQQSTCVNGSPSAPTLTLATTQGITYSVSAPAPYSPGQTVTVTATWNAGSVQPQTLPDGWIMTSATSATYTVTFTTPDCSTPPPPYECPPGTTGGDEDGDGVIEPGECDKLVHKPRASVNASCVTQNYGEGVAKLRNKGDFVEKFRIVRSGPDVFVKLRPGKIKPVNLFGLKVGSVVKVKSRGEVLDRDKVEMRPVCQPAPPPHTGAKESTAPA
ncbi:MAG TPA: hypothetical protein PK911_03980 [Candidatus Saccharibacteria bacterium]|nr:hypothetical protein [Candidatus Saccharibacteria bacterium]